MIPEEAHSTLEIPVIDMHRLLSVESGTSELEKLHQSPCLQGMGILPEKVIGLTPHSDGIGLAILLQSNEVEGLQIRKDGVADLRWLQGDAVPKAMEEINTKPLATSLLVPSVQELAKQNFSSVPQRYIQHQHEDMVLICEETNTTSSLEIPVIDMHNLLSIEAENSELDKLHLACKEWGFFQLINHGVSPSLLKKLKLEIQDFFNLPMSEKKKFWQTPQHIEGFGQAYVVSEDQKLDWGDMFYMTTLPTHSRIPHLFPQLPLPFRDTLELYSCNMKNIAMAIIGQMGKALKIEEMEIRELFEDEIQKMRMNYYPPCPQPEKVIGLTNHSDGVGLTILLHVNEVEGLQIKKDGVWVPIKPLPNAFVVNIGEILEIVTNGIYQSIEHRATVNSEIERLSIATFHSPELDVVVGPVASLITEQTPARFKRIKMEDYFRGRFARKLDGKCYLDTIRI
ncbi:hypothetical protein JHK84_035119 [Glycine max]|nr:hypothetical protein JHK84_035119 [Glycine max]